MADLLGGAKAGGGLNKLVDGFLDRARVAEQVGEGMVAAPGTMLGPDATRMAGTMGSESAAGLGMFGPQAGNAKAGSAMSDALPLLPPTCVIHRVM